MTVCKMAARARLFSRSLGITARVASGPKAVVLCLFEILSNASFKVLAADRSDIWPESFNGTDDDAVTVACDAGGGIAVDLKQFTYDWRNGLSEFSGGLGLTSLEVVAPYKERSNASQDQRRDEPEDCVWVWHVIFYAIALSPLLIPLT